MSTRIFFYFCKEPECDCFLVQKEMKAAHEYWMCSVGELVWDMEVWWLSDEMKWID